MDAMRITLALLRASIWLMVFSLGLKASLADVVRLERRPGLLLRSLVAMNVVMPLVAIALAFRESLNPAVRAALVFLSVSPVPPVLPRKQSKLGGSADYIHGLLVATALLSIVIVPLTIEILGRAFGKDVHIGPGPVAKIVVTSVLLPFVAGMVMRKAAPRLANRTAQPLSMVAFLVLLAAAVALLAVSLPAMLVLIGNGTLLAMTVFVVVAVAVGHWMGGPDPAERTVLALATAARHPGVAITIAMANYPNQNKMVAAAILLYMVVNGVVLIPYSAWRKNRLQSSELGRGTTAPRAA
jgi:bile acid:Na+ symporter, BASS family